jgi:hypothetical protein
MFRLAKGGDADWHRFHVFIIRFIINVIGNHRHDHAGSYRSDCYSLLFASAGTATVVFCEAGYCYEKKQDDKPTVFVVI